MKLAILSLTAALGVSISPVSAQPPVTLVPPPVVVSPPPVVVAPVAPVVVAPAVYPLGGLTIVRPGFGLTIGGGYPAYGYGRPYPYYHGGYPHGGYYHGGYYHHR